MKSENRKRNSGKVTKDVGRTGCNYAGDARKQRNGATPQHHQAPHPPMSVNGALFEHVPIATLEMLRLAATMRTGVQRDRPTNMQSAPDIKLSPSEKWTLQKIAEGEFPIRELDWVALQRLKKLGLVEDRGAGVGITKEGRTMLRRLTLPS